MRIVTSALLGAVAALALACGDDSSPPSTASSSSSGGDTSQPPATTEPPPSTTTTDPGTTDPTTVGPSDSTSSGGADSTSSGGGDSTSSGGEESDSSSSGGEESSSSDDGEESSSGGPVEPVHGCTPDIAVDMTGMAAVTISDIDAWDFGHQACVTVSPGTEVTWEGDDFGLHPLVGGISPATDPASPITAIGANSGSAPAVFTVPAGAGEYPYFCENHFGSMFGVIYVVE